ncbi:MAG: hypothetical protein ACFFG0_54540 [Candidatus Thorarchaeota archaeon]
MIKVENSDKKEKLTIDEWKIIFELENAYKNKYIENAYKEIKLLRLCNDKIMENNKIIPNFKINDYNEFDCKYYFEIHNYYEKGKIEKSIIEKYNLGKEYIELIKNKFYSNDLNKCGYCISRYFCDISSEEFQEFLEKRNRCNKCGVKIEKISSVYIVYDLYKKIKENNLNVNIDDKILCCECFREKEDLENFELFFNELVEDVPEVEKLKEKLFDYFKIRYM